MYRSRITTLFILALCVLMPASGAIIVDQSPANGLGYVAQNFTDLGFSALQFDDFTTSQAWALTTLTVYGTEMGNSSFNTAVTAEIWSGLPGSGSLVMSTVSGSQVGANLNLDFGGQALGAGSYWLTAYVTRSFSGGGQWFWNSFAPVSGSESFLYDPSNYFGYGAAPIAGSLSLHAQIPLDMSFTLNGSEVPEPSTLGLVLAGSALVAFARRRC